MPIDYSLFEPHVFWGALAGAGISFILVLGTGNWLVLILFAIFIGIAVDVAAHGYQH